jgi:hypothetical protein
MAGLGILLAVENYAGGALARNDEPVIVSALQPRDYLAGHIDFNVLIACLNRDAGLNGGARPGHRVGDAIDGTFRPRGIGRVNIDRAFNQHLVDEDLQFRRTHIGAGYALGQVRQVEEQQTFRAPYTAHIHCRLSAEVGGICGIDVCIACQRSRAVGRQQGREEKSQAGRCDPDCVWLGWHLHSARPLNFPCVRSRRCRYGGVGQDEGAFSTVPPPP